MIRATRSGLAALQLALLGVITALIAAEGVGLDSALRHLYVIPAVWAALAAGSRGGGLIGLVAGLLQAPWALPAIETLGVVSHTVDGLVSMVTPFAFGWVAGRLVDQSRGRILRLRGVLEVQRGLSREAPLAESLPAVAERVRAALGADRVGLVLAEDAEARAVASAPSGTPYDHASAAGWSLRFARTIWSNDLGTDPRFSQPGALGAAPTRGVVLPLDSGSGLVGVLAVEHRGDLSAASRVAAREIALHLALGIESVRLALRQRRFAEELELKVAAATDRLKELDQAKTEFLSVVAHELRTPLTALQGFSELLLSRTVPPERARRFLGHMHGEARRLGRIVTELLDVSRIEAGRCLELRRELIDLNEIMERNVEMFAPEHRRHRFEWAPCAGSAQLEGDRDAVDRMLKNLLSNAVKYSPKGGRIVVAAAPALDHPGMIELSVEDEGVGIPGSDLGRIFDKYVRVPHPDTAVARGLGLGLSLVKALAEAHGGRVEVDSLPGKGSRFRLLLPALAITREHSF